MYRRVSINSSVDGKSYVARDVGGLRDGEWPQMTETKETAAPVFQLQGTEFCCQLEQAREWVLLQGLQK